MFIHFVLNQIFIHIEDVFHFLQSKNMSDESGRVNEIQEVNSQDQKMNNSRSTVVKKHMYTINLT